MKQDAIDNYREEAAKRSDTDLIEVVIFDSLDLGLSSTQGDLEQPLEETGNYTLARLLVSREELHKRLHSDTPGPISIPTGFGYRVNL